LPAIREDAMAIQLLLAHADSYKPVRHGGLDLRAARAAEKPGISPPDPSHLADRSASPDALPLQRWRIVAPKGDVGDRLLQLVAPLKQRREEEQGAPAVVSRVDPGMGFGAANAWIQQDYRGAFFFREDNVRSALHRGTCRSPSSPPPIRRATSCERTIARARTGSEGS
jgi:hypothetical protein